MATPLGEIPLDAEACATISKLPSVLTRPDVHAEEHSVEVQLPFLQRVLGDFTVVPLVVGDVDAGTVADVLEACWGGPETLVVISSDLSHYHPYGEARRLDAETIEAILDCQGPINPHRACGAYPISGLLAVARRRRLRPTLLGACNSGDTAGDRAELKLREAELTRPLGQRAGANTEAHACRDEGQEAGPHQFAAIIYH